MLHCKALAGVVCLAILGCALRAEAQEANNLDARLRLLEKAIVAARGLEFKAPVRARVVARLDGVDKGTQGYYDPSSKTLFLYDDIADNYRQGVLIHEMVHALQDQHFDLVKLKARLHAPEMDDDAELALAALIEGDATYTMIEVLKKEQPAVAKMLDAPLAGAKNLRNAFLYGEGARYVQKLKSKGGWASINQAYKFPPGSTATILSGGGIATVDLSPGKTFGAYRLIETLGRDEKTRPQAVKLAQAWRGGVERKSAAGTAWLFACKDEASAEALGAALLFPSSEKSKNLVVRQGTRIQLLNAATDQAIRSLRDEVEGPPSLTVFSARDKKTLTFGDFAQALLEADVVCIGEAHDSDLHHRVQHYLIKALHAQDSRLGVGLEMFQKPFQKALDQYAKGESNEAEFLARSEYESRWGYDWSLYRPIIEFCRRNQLPLAALNAPRELTRRISKVGIENLEEMEKMELGPIDLQVAAHRTHWVELLGQMHGKTKPTAEQKERSYQVMATWDDYMARSAAAFQKERGLRRLVIIAGSGHIERRFGIPDRLARYSGLKVVSVGIAGPGDAGEVLTDYEVRLR